MSNNAGVSGSVVSINDHQNASGVGADAKGLPKRASRPAISAEPGRAFTLADCMKEFASSIAGAAIDLAPLPSAFCAVDTENNKPLTAVPPSEPKNQDANALNNFAFSQNGILEAKVLNELPQEELGKLAAHVLCRLPFCEQQKLGPHVLAGLSPEALGGLSALFVCSLSENTFKSLSKDVRNNLSDIAQQAANMRELNPSASTNFVQSCLFDLEAPNRLSFHNNYA